MLVFFVLLTFTIADLPNKTYRNAIFLCIDCNFLQIIYLFYVNFNAFFIIEIAFLLNIRKKNQRKKRNQVNADQLARNQRPRKPRKVQTSQRLVICQKVIPKKSIRQRNPNQSRLANSLQRRRRVQSLILTRIGVNRRKEARKVVVVAAVVV